MQDKDRTAKEAIAGAISGVGEEGNGLDPFSPENLLVDQDIVGGGGQKVLTIGVAKRPPKQVYARVHPDPAFHIEKLAIIDHEATRELYVVTVAVQAALAIEFRTCDAYLAVTQHKDLFFWLTRVPDATRGGERWSASNRDAVQRAIMSWVRVHPNQSAGQYDIFIGGDILGEPIWPDPVLSVWELLRIAFKDRVIQTLDHPIVRQLQGQSA
jgi:hypothetical protein